MEYRIEQDEYPESPREWDNLTTLICFHNRYDLGDDHDYNSEDYQSWEELEQAIVENENPLHISPLFLYDHSGLYLKIGDWHNSGLAQGHAHFDSGQVGFVIVTQESVDKLGTPLEFVPGQAKGEVETYAAYLSGNVYGFVITEECSECEQEKIIDSCYGFYDYNECEKEAKRQIEYYQEKEIV